jgi:hypothetical protein
MKSGGPRRRSDLSRFETLLARALCARDPVAELARAARDRNLSPELRKRLAAADSDGFRISALLVVRLRFERLLRGSPEAEEWFERDGESFAAAFRDYHEAIPPTAFFPRDEAALFAKWNAGQSHKENK